MQEPIKLFIADDHPILRAGIKSIFADSPEFTVIGEAEDGEKTIEKVMLLKPEVVILDITMPGINGIETTRRIRQRLPEVKVIILSMHKDHNYVIDALKAGAGGYVLKGSESEELTAAVLKVASGRKYISPDVGDELLSEYVIKRQNDKRQNDPLSALTEREKEIFNLIAEGDKNKDIATKLSISVFTVKKHRANLMEKLGINDTAGIVRLAISKGLIKSSD